MEKQTTQTDENSDDDQPTPEQFRIPTVAEIDQMRVDRNLTQRELSRRAGFEKGRFNTILHKDMDPHTETMRSLLEVIQEADADREEQELASQRGPKPTPSPALEEDESSQDGEYLDRWEQLEKKSLEEAGLSPGVADD